jgi:hypothetical protein
MVVLRFRRRALKSKTVDFAYTIGGVCENIAVCLWIGAGCLFMLCAIIKLMLEPLWGSTGG